MTSILLTEVETAKRLTLKSSKTLAQWRFHRRHPLRFVRVGRSIRYREEDVQKFIEEQTVSGTSEPLIRGRRKARN